MTTKKTDRQNICYIYQDKAARWRWRLNAPNGETLSVSGEGDGFATKLGARKNFKLTGGNAAIVYLVPEEVKP